MSLQWGYRLPDGLGSHPSLEGPRDRVVTRKGGGCKSLARGDSAGWNIPLSGTIITLQTDRKDATMCEQCREFGITGRESYAWRLEDGQRVTLCLSHARIWRGMMPVGLRPVPYGRRTRDAIAANAIVGVTA